MDQTPTQDGQTGIWIARIRGDDDQYSAQRELVQKLRFYLGQEAALKNLMDVRELAQEVAGATESEGEILARQLGQRVNAAIVIWGELASLLKKDEFFPMITIVETVKGIDPTIRLEPVNEISLIQENQTPRPFTLRAAPQRVREPIGLSRYVMAAQYYKKGDWAHAADHFEALIKEGISQSIHGRDLHIYAGHSNYYRHFAKDSRDSREFLVKAKNHFLSAQLSYENTEKDNNYPAVLNMLGIIYSLLGSSLEEAEKLLTEASRLWKERGDEKRYSAAQGNLGAYYWAMAARDINTHQNIERGIRVIEKLLKEHGNTGEYSVNRVNLGNLYLKRSDKSPTRTSDLQQAVKHFLIATEHNKIRSPWSTYTWGEIGLAHSYAGLVHLGVEVEINLSKSITAWEEVAAIYHEHKFSEKYADVRIQMARSYSDAAQKGIDFSENMTKAISALKGASSYYKELNQLAKYADAQNNLAVSYWDLAQHNIDNSANLLQMKLTLEDGIDLFRKHGLMDQEKKFKEMLEPINKVLSDGEKHARFHQVSCFQDSPRTKEYGPGYSSGTIQSTCVKVEA
jgi:tetratricopeptide (TPR) repeat protein